MYDKIVRFYYMSQELTLIAFGAGIGLITGVLGRVIYDSLVRETKKSSILKGIINELKGLKNQCVNTTWLVYIRYGLMNREILDWIYDNFVDLKDIEDSDTSLESLERLRTYDDVTLANTFRMRHQIGESNRTGLSFKKNRLLYIENNINNLSLFDIDIQYKILEIIKKLDRINQHIDHASKYFDLTFTLDEDNYHTVSRNYDDSARNIGRWNYQLANDISKFVKKYEN